MPQTTQDITKIIENDSQRVISNMLWDLIDEHKRVAAGHERELYLRYQQESGGVPIYQKTFQNYEKVHERIPNDFFGDIVDLKTGYMGNEITIEVGKSREPNEATRESKNDFLRRFSVRESSADKNSELVKMSAIAGRAYRLLFVAANEDGNGADVSMENLDPWETVVYYDGVVKRPVYAMHYFQIADSRFDGSRGPGSNKPVTKQKYRVEWYDATSITYYRENEEGEFVLDAEQAPGGTQPHLLGGVPIIEFKNNEETLAEAEKVLELIDAYDNIISDSTSEVEQLRMAYMWARGTGMMLTAEFEDMLRQTGIWPLPENGAIGFAGKDLSGAGGFVQTILAEIRRNIYSFSKSLDLSQEHGGEMRVIGWQLAMLRLEMSSQVTERKFRRSYLRQYELLGRYWRQFKEVDIDPYTLQFTFTRKFPKDIDQEVDTLVKAFEVLPLEEAYALMTFIDKPSELAEKFRKEKPPVISSLSDALANDDDAEPRLG